MIKPRGKHPREKLTAAFIRQTTKEGFYCDGNCLYLRVEPTGSKRWVLKVVSHGKRHDIGLGGVSYVSLAEARAEAARLRRIARQGGDPLLERRKERRVTPTFEDLARELHKAYEAAFTNKKHARQWFTSLQSHVFPVIGTTPVDMIRSSHVLEILTPIWTTKSETARRVRQRMKAVFDFAKAKGHRAGMDNPVEGITKVLPSSRREKGHFKSLPYAKVPEFIQELRECNASMAARLAFELLILTASRTGEVLLAEWREVDFETKTWTVPASRMKGKVEHRVPLSRRALEILDKARELSPGGLYAFPGRSPGDPLSNGTLLMLLRRMGRLDMTVHGFRSAFKTWSEETTRFPTKVIEACLAHALTSKVEDAYLRTTFFDQRRELMNAWTDFVVGRRKRG